ncbi:hypothetical protein HDF16_002830 [Granulicella aggregans]|uniref:Uncharacterized protein n=1 Tax=Granulicella aggregans TaxID=474949 RepID=A0A7W7ZEG8_9BACT|nr:hypothetical protein [Granulicella aggregans]
METAGMWPRIICTCFGMLLLYFVAHGTITGRAFGKFGELDRIRQPFGYWLVLVSQAAAGILLFVAAILL